MSVGLGIRHVPDDSPENWILHGMAQYWVIAIHGFFKSSHGVHDDDETIQAHPSFVKRDGIINNLGCYEANIWNKKGQGSSKEP